MRWVNSCSLTPPVSTCTSQLPLSPTAFSSITAQSLSLSLCCSAGPDSTHRLTGLRLFLYQYTALLVKRFHYTRRKTIAFLVQNILPLFVIAACLGIARYTLSVSDPPSLFLRPSLFFGISSENYMFVGGVKNIPGHKNYINTLLRPCGLGSEKLSSSFDCSSPCYDPERAPVTCPSLNHTFTSLNQSYSCPPQDLNYTCAFLDFMGSTCPSCNCTRRSPPSLPSCFNGTVVRNLPCHYLQVIFLRILNSVHVTGIYFTSDSKLGIEKCKLLSQIQTYQTKFKLYSDKIQNLAALNISHSGSEEIVQ